MTEEHLNEKLFIRPSSPPVPTYQTLMNPAENISNTSKTSDNERNSISSITNNILELELGHSASKMPVEQHRISLTPSVERGSKQRIFSTPVVQSSIQCRPLIAIRVIDMKITSEPNISPLSVSQLIIGNRSILLSPASSNNSYIEKEIRSGETPSPKIIDTLPKCAATADILPKCAATADILPKCAAKMHISEEYPPLPHRVPI
jgi:hypothetical protein